MAASSVPCQRPPSSCAFDAFDVEEAAAELKLAAGQGFQPARDALGRFTATYPAGTQVRITGLTATAALTGRLGLSSN